MPKNKTHKGTAKRVKVSGGGKLLHERAGTRHKLEKKPSTTTRRLAGVAEITSSDAKRIKKLLGR